MNKDTLESQDEELIERLAAIEHQRWADWQKWCHKVLRENNPSPEQGDILERWDRQIETPYSELSEPEKQSDRDQVMRYWSLLSAWHSQRVAQTEKAYGGCHNCYGKGYATVNDSWAGTDEWTYERFAGGNPNAMKFCTCSRGEQLEARIAQQVQVGILDARIATKRSQ